MKKNCRVALAAILLMIAPHAVAADGDLFTYLRDHASAVFGTVVVDDTKEKLVELRLVDAFEISKKHAMSGEARVSLFSITRAGEAAPQATIPTSADELKMYSDGEVWLALYKRLNDNVSVEVLGGFMFKMISVTGQTGDPLDGTKAAFGVGLRFEKNGYKISVVPAHFGPVVEDKKLAGFVPSLLIHSYIPAPFLGKNTALVPDFAFGRKADKTFSRNLKLAIATRF